MCPAPPAPGTALCAGKSAGKACAGAGELLGAWVKNRRYKMLVLYRLFLERFGILNLIKPLDH